MIVVDYQSGDYDQRLDVVEILRPLHKALDKMTYTWRKMGMRGGVAPYRWTDEDMDKLDDILDRLRDRYREMESANRQGGPTMNCGPTGNGTGDIGPWPAGFDVALAERDPTGDHRPRWWGVLDLWRWWGRFGRPSHPPERRWR